MNGKRPSNFSQQKQKKQTEVSVERQFLSIKDAAKYSSLSPRLLYQLVERREIRSFKVGKRIVLDINDLDQFIRQGVQEPRDWSEEARKVLEQ